MLPYPSVYILVYTLEDHPRLTYPTLGYPMSSSFTVPWDFLPYPRMSHVSFYFSPDYATLQKDII